MPHPRRRRTRRPASRVPVWARWGLALALLLPLVGSPRPAAAAGQEKAAATFARFERAWKDERADRVSDLMPAGGTSRFTLLAYPWSGKTRSMKPGQARVSLRKYFERIQGPALKDVTPERAPASVRHYAFTYTPAQKNKRTTLLHVQLKRSRNGAWVLASVTESVRRR